MIELHNIDCMEYMRALPDKAFDVCITDPPYGVSFKYKSYNDSKEATTKFILDFMPEILRVCNRAIITSGISLMYEYPKPNWVGCWYTPAGAGIGTHGFCTWQPILIYGKDPKGGKGSYPDGFTWTGTADKDASFHPCPKPIKLWKKIINRWTKDGDTIFDPFIGSATTAIACHDMGFDLVGCELDKDYYEAACKRLKNHQMQQKLF